MLLQTNSYIVPAEKRTEHQRLLRRFRQVMARLGCDGFECYEQVGANWAGGETTGRFVQIMRFRDHQHQRAVQAAERTDATAQALIAEFCDLINLPYQQQQGLFAVGYYRGVVKPSERDQAGAEQHQEPETAGGDGEQPYQPDQEHAEHSAVSDEVAADQTVEPMSEAELEMPVEESAAEQAASEALSYAPDEAAAEALADHAGHGGNNEFAAEEPALQEEQVEIDVEAERAHEPRLNHEHAGPPAPALLDEIDLDALAQEELSQMENPQTDRARHRG